MHGVCRRGSAVSTALTSDGTWVTTTPSALHQETCIKSQKPNPRKDKSQHAL